MRFAISSEQRKFFLRKGYIAFDEIPTTKEREIAQLISELADLKPLRIAEKKHLKECPKIPIPFDDSTDCALLQSLQHGWAIVFNSAFPKIEALYPNLDGEFVYTLFTKRFLNPERHPVVYS